MRCSAGPCIVPGRTPTVLPSPTLIPCRRRTDPDPGAAARAEADAFFCFVELMAGCRDLFCAQLDNAAGGVRATLSALGSALRAADPALAEHVLDANGVAPHYFAFRWITLVLTQEFAFPDVLRIWDAIVSAPTADRGAALLRVCLAMLLLARDELLQVGRAWERGLGMGRGRGLGEGSGGWGEWGRQARRGGKTGGRGWGGSA